jgi:hypothetical protein
MNKGFAHFKSQTAKGAFKTAYRRLRQATNGKALYPLELADREYWRSYERAAIYALTRRD